MSNRKNNDDELITHLFFDGVVTINGSGSKFYDFVNIRIDMCFEDMATRWLDPKKFSVINVISANVLGALWLTRIYREAAKTRLGSWCLFLWRT